MPTYEFRCPQGHDFEKFYRTISGAEAQAACPMCGEPAERVMSATGFAFKGSGFYLTDYGKNAHRDKGTPAPASGGAGEGGGESAKGDAKADAAPAASGSGASSGEAKAKGESKPTSESKPAEPKAAAPAKRSSTE